MHSFCENRKNLGLYRISQSWNHLFILFKLLFILVSVFLVNFINTSNNICYGWNMCLNDQVHCLIWNKTFPFKIFYIIYFISLFSVQCPIVVFICFSSNLFLTVFQNETMVTHFVEFYLCRRYTYFNIAS